MFKRAERKQAKLRMAICGPSGSGKTFSALLVAQGLGSKIAMIDTEQGSGELYSDMLEYDVASLRPPYTPRRYIELIKGAESAGYHCLIIDSLTHAWTGEGGVLDMHDKAAQAERNSYTAWRHVTPEHDALVNAILSTEMHIITTIRTKTAYDLQEDKNGKKKPVKIGMAPVQRDGMEYEFTVVMDLSVEGHVASVTKDRTSLFDGQHFVPNVDTGETLLEWLESGASAVITDEQVHALARLAKSNGWDGAMMKEKLDDMKLGRLTDIPKNKLADVKKAFETKIHKPVDSAAETA